MIARACYTNWATISAASVTVSSAELTLPKANIQHPWKTKVWRATGKIDEYVQFDFGSALGVSEFVLVNHNLTAAATVTLLGATNSAMSPVAYTSPALTVSTQWGLVAWHPPTTQTFRYWRVRLQDSTNSAAFVEAGWVFLGPAVDFDYRPGFVLRPNDPSVMTSSDDGQKSVYDRTKFRTVDFLIGDHQDLTELQDLAESVGWNRDFVFQLDPSNKSFDNVSDGLWRFTLYGSLKSLSLGHKYKGVVDAPITFEEAR